jgi:hypothetical protein
LHLGHETVTPYGRDQPLVDRSPAFLLMVIVPERIRHELGVSSKASGYRPSATVSTTVSRRACCARYLLISLRHTELLGDPRWPRLGRRLEGDAKGEVSIADLADDLLPYFPHLLDRAGPTR